MPRGTASSKRQPGAANNRDTRHENGLVGPGKRITKQKSNGQLAGQAKAAVDSGSPAPPLPTSSHTPPSATPPLLLANGCARLPAAADASSDLKMRSDLARRASLEGDSEFSSAESYHNMSGVSVSQENHRRIDVNAAKNPAVHRDIGPLGLALTVLRSCPLGDTIAILIVLLQIPPTFLSLIHLLFATLTFVTPSNAANSALSFTDIFEGTLGTPSVATIVVIDLFVLMVWLFLWTPLQDVALDLAQTVIALTLGGGTSGREAGMNNVFVCFGVISLSHIFGKNGSVKNSSLRALLSSSTKGLISGADHDDLSDLTYQDSKPQNTHRWIRSILAIHILTQGVVRYIRDWYVRREKRDNSAAVDPEAGKSVTENGHDPSAVHSQTPETEPSTPLTATHPTVTSKKKRKQSAQVRLRQPLWSALASTKIVMVKEYETSHTAAESAGTNATDVNNLGNAPFDTQADRIWITYVGPDEVFFGTSYFPSHVPPENSNKEATEAGIDESKPFYVRVNHTVWQPTKINISNDDSANEARWTGEIFGLAPNSSYLCEFISTIDDFVIFSTSVRTSNLPTADIAVGLAPNPAVSGRPGSPTTTLKTSIASSEVKLAEERSRQKREKKDQRAKLGSLRKEIEKLGNSITSGGGNEDRQKQKYQQHISHMKQAEEAILQLESQIETLETVPTDEKSQYTNEKRAFQSERDQYKQARATFNEAKEAADRDIQALTNDVAVLQQKRERMQIRITKLNGEHERITDASARGLDEAQRKERERVAKEAERAKLEMMLLERLNTLSAKAGETAGNLQALYVAIDNLQQAEIYAQAQQANSPTSSVPNLNAAFGPEAGMQEGSVNYHWNQQTSIYPSSAFANNQVHNPHQAFNSPPAPAGTGVGGARHRGRSSSMLSNVSGFTQSSGEGGPPPHSSMLSPHPPAFIAPAGTGSGNGSSKRNEYADKDLLLEDSTPDVDDDDDVWEDGRARQGSDGSSGSSEPRSPTGGALNAPNGFGFGQGHGYHGFGHASGNGSGVGNGNGRVSKW